MIVSPSTGAEPTEGRGDYITLVDGDTRRRAAIAFFFAGLGFHVEPLETVDELDRHWPQQGVIFVHDATTELIDVVGSMAAADRWLPVIAFSEMSDPGRIVNAVLSGAIDYVVWPFDEATFIERLHDALARAEQRGDVRLRQAQARQRIGKLTNRERQVLAGMAQGFSNRAIAETLSISPRTVEIHRANLLTKIGATHSAEAIRLAIEGALLDRAA